MSRSFTKLFSSITESTVWSEPHATRITWIAMLAMADRKGRVWASVPGLANRARVTTKEAETALGRFLAPDRYSRTPDHEGRRIELIDGGWRLLNYEKYRALRDDDDRRQYQREWVKEKRALHVDVDRKSTNVDRSRPASTQAEAEADVNPNPLGHDVALIEFETAWKELPRRSGNNPKAWSTRIREGVKPAAMIEGARRYHTWCEQAGKINTEMVMRGSTFFGHARPFEQDFTLPPMNGSPWFLSASAIDEKGRAQGKIPPQDKIAWLAFRDEVFAANGITVEMLNAAKKDFTT